MYTLHYQNQKQKPRHLPGTKIYKGKPGINKIKKINYLNKIKKLYWSQHRQKENKNISDA